MGLDNRVRLKNELTKINIIQIRRQKQACDIHIFHANDKQKKPKVAILISDKVGLRTNNINMFKGDCVTVIKGVNSSRGH